MERVEILVYKSSCCYRSLNISINLSTHQHLRPLLCTCCHFLAAVREIIKLASGYIDMNWLRIVPKASYTLSDKLSNFNVWRHTWRKNWVNYAVLKAIAQASELSFPVVFHTENSAVHSGNPTVSSVYLPTPRWLHLKALNRTDKKLTNLMGKLFYATEHSVQFFVQFFTQLNCTV
jgi:hypothetical protein